MTQHMPFIRRETRRMLSLLVLLAFLAAGFGPGQAAPGIAPLAQQGVRFEPSDCVFSVPAGLEQGVECGTLVVPEMYENPNGKTIQLAVAIFRSPSANPAPDPLVLLQGGPGSSTIDTFTQIFSLVGWLRTDRDVILFDQRGTLYSRPALLCPEALDLNIELLDENLPDAEENQRSLEAMQACKERLESEGVNLSAYNSVENATDVEALREALGYDQINLYGVSYGTLLALHVMRLYPEGLRSVILDSIVPTEINTLPEVPQSINRGLEALFDACQGDKDCNEEYPNLRQVFYEQVDRLNANPVTIDVTDSETGNTHPALVDGEMLISAVFQLMYLGDMVPLLPRAIYDVRAGDYTLIERAISLMVFDRTISYGMYYSVWCAEDADFAPEDYNLSGLPPQIVALEDDSAQYWQDLCSLWNVQPLGPEVDEPVVSDIPTLVVSGAFDPITPPSYGEAVMQTLSNGYFLVFPRSAHGALIGNECADEIMAEFLANPNSAPDASCLEAQRQVEWVTPGSIVRLPVLLQFLNLQQGRMPQALVYLAALLFLLTALVVYPIVWLVRLFSRKPAPAEPFASQPDAVITPDARRPGIYRLAPWLSGVTALLLLIFTVVLVGTVISMIAANDARIYYGLPGSARPLFTLPLLAAILAVLMLFAALAAWINRSGSGWGRFYFTLLSLAALTCVGILAVWGMVTALLGG